MCFVLCTNVRVLTKFHCFDNKKGSMLTHLKRLSTEVHCFLCHKVSTPLYIFVAFS